MSDVGSPLPISAHSEIDEDEIMSDDISSSSSSSTASSRASSPHTPSSYRSRPSITISYPMQPSNASSSRLNISFPPHSKLSEPQGFIAPAHPQSHHLHVLPPRKKTTRALIIDHTIWRLVRTRFAQARCELGMHVKLTSHAWHEETDLERNEVGFHALHVRQQHQHGNFGDPPEIDVASSDEEDGDEDEDENVTECLYGQNSAKPTWNVRPKASRMVVDDDDDSDDDEEEEEKEEEEENEEEDRRASQRRRAAAHNRRHAPFLSVRAEGMQKVLFAVLLQPVTSPPVSFAQLDDSAMYPMSINPSSPESLRTMPNRLRLALMLLRIVDDLFGSPKTLSTQSPSASAPDSSTSPPTAFFTPSFSTRAPTVDTLPTHLESLFQVSNQSLVVAKPTSSFRTLPLPSDASGSNPLKERSGDEAANVFSWNKPSEPSSETATIAVSGTGSQSFNNAGLRIRSTLAGSSYPKAGNPQSWRLAANHIIDDSYKTGVQTQSSVHSPKQASGRARDLYFLGCNAAPSGAVTAIGRLSSSITPLSFGSSTWSSSNSGYSIHKLETLCSRHLREKCTVCVRNADARTRIGAGLLSSSGSWFLDRRRRSSKQTGSVLADLISDFMRLSAYIISELQEYVIGDDFNDSESTSSPSSSEEVEGGGEESELGNEEQQERSHYIDSNYNTIGEEGMSHKPTRAWYSLLCGLITRAVLEGYVSRGWKGSRYVEVLMGLGLGVEDDSTTLPQSLSNVPDESKPQRTVADEDEDDECLPEGTPSLAEACHILFDGFGKHLQIPNMELRPPEREYVSIMEARITEFLEIPHSCPDLATHLTGLSAKYPAEPVERAALQFCEAVSRWRGKPELEMHKAKRKPVVSSLSDLWIRKYFQIPVEDTHDTEHQMSPASSSTERGIKRQGSPHRETFPPVLKKGKLKDDDHMESGDV